MRALRVENIVDHTLPVHFFPRRGAGPLSVGDVSDMPDYSFATSPCPNFKFLFLSIRLSRHSIRDPNIIF